MARGGHREGAGRKKGLASITAEKARAFVVDYVHQKLEPIMQAQTEAAIGLYYEDPEKGIVYKQKPDVNAGKYLLDQAIGKATETVKVEAEVKLKLDL